MTDKEKLRIAFYTMVILHVVVILGITTATLLFIQDTRTTFALSVVTLILLYPVATTAAQSRANWWYLKNKS